MTEEIIVRFAGDEFSLGPVSEFYDPPDSRARVALTAEMREILQGVIETILYDADQENPATLTIELR